MHLTDDDHGDPGEDREQPPPYDTRISMNDATENLHDVQAGSQSLALVMQSQLPHDPSKWTKKDVQIWLSFTVGLPLYAAAFNDHCVDGNTLMRVLREEHILSTFDVNDENHREKIISSIQDLREKQVCW